MPLDPEVEALLNLSFKKARLVGLAVCYGAIATYLLVVFVAAFQGDAALLLRSLQGQPGVPWRNPLVLGLIILAVTQMAFLPTLRDILMGKARRAKHVAAAMPMAFSATVMLCALLETVAIYGLVLAFAVGPATAPLSLLMMLVPPLAYPLLIPQREAWQSLAEGFQSQSPRG